MKKVLMSMVKANGSNQKLDEVRRQRDAALARIGQMQEFFVGEMAKSIEEASGLEGEVEKSMEESAQSNEANRKLQLKVAQAKHHERNISRNHAEHAETKRPKAR